MGPSAVHSGIKDRLEIVLAYLGHTYSPMTSAVVSFHTLESVRDYGGNRPPSDLRLLA